MTGRPVPNPGRHPAAYGYDLLWRLVIPLLRKHHRLGTGYDQRILAAPLPEADIWIQAASIGEVNLARLLAERINIDNPPGSPKSILITTHTRQGLDILKNDASFAPDVSSDNHTRFAYFPFDRPGLMTQAVALVRPRCVVLLETELWPGFLSALKQADVPILLVNGRLSKKSYRFYRLFDGFWKHMAPDHVLAVSDADARRFSRLFGPDRVSRMANMKFDRFMPENSDSESLRIPGHPSFVVLGSVRRKEETDILNMIKRIRSQKPDAMIGLFPRHAERLPFWEKKLSAAELPYVRRSGMENDVPKGQLTLWDTFGELTAAYKSASAAFVGGSLAPLGGQNFLEALMGGIRPVIGPYWDNFAWIDDTLFSAGLIRVAPDWKTAADLLISDLNGPDNRKSIQRQAGNLLARHQGGTRAACRLIEQTLGKTST